MRTGRSFSHVDGIVLVVTEGETGMRETRQAVSLLPPSPPEKRIGCTPVRRAAAAVACRRGRRKDDVLS